VYDPTPATSPVSSVNPPSIRLVRDSHDRFTDGRHTYWSDERGGVRWSRLAQRGDWLDDGIGVASHGGGRTLEQAVANAHANERILIDVRADQARTR
jgi:hypothetical protein